MLEFLLAPTCLACPTDLDNFCIVFGCPTVTNYFAFWIFSIIILRALVLDLYENILGSLNVLVFE